MMRKRIWLQLVIISLLFSHMGLALSITQPAEVYRNDNISVAAGVVDVEKKIIHFGDILTFVVSIYYDPNQIQLQEMDAGYFSNAWPEANGAYLLSHQSLLFPSSGEFPLESRNIYQFQILACPDNAILCRGTRQYEVPEFTLQYDMLNPSANLVSTESIQFRPWPTGIMVVSAIPLDEEGQLDIFHTYFPAGAYPDPLSGQKKMSSGIGFITGGLFLLLGGIWMSPLSFFKRRSFIPKPKVRWELQLEQLQTVEYETEEHFLDALRRAMVWYCTDELDLDPFYWVKHQEEVSGEKQKGMGEYEGFKILFVELLHSPTGEGKILLERFSQLVADRKKQ